MCFRICLGLIRSLLIKDSEVIKKALAEIDYFTILLLIGLFIVVGSITEAGVVDDISNIFIKLSKDNIFVIYTLIVWDRCFFQLL